MSGGKYDTHFLLRDGSEADRKKEQSNRIRPKKHERKVAAAVGGRTQPASGALAAFKGDVDRRSNDGFPLLIECKRSMGHASLSVKASWLTKITNEAFAKDKYPALALQFDDEVMRQQAQGGRHPADTDWVAVPLTVFKAMLERLGEEPPEL